MSIFATTKEVSFDEHVKKIGPSEFIYLSITTSYIKELELADRDFSSFYEIKLTILRLPSRTAQKIISALKNEGCS